MPKTDTPKITNAIKLEDLAAAWTKLGLHMTTRRYRQIADEGKVPASSRGYIDALKALIQLCIYYQTLAEGSGSLSLTDERTRLCRINADQKQLNLEKARGDTIDTAKAQQVWSAVMMNIVNKLEFIPAKLPPLVYGHTIPEIKAIVEKMLFEARNEIANPDLRELARSASGSRTSKPYKTKAHPLGKRVGRQKPNTKPRGKRRAGTMVHG